MAIAIHPTKDERSISQGHHASMVHGMGQGDPQIFQVQEGKASIPGAGREKEREKTCQKSFTAF